MVDITVTITGEEAQHLLDSMDTHVKTHGLKVAPRSVAILMKFQAAAADQTVVKGTPADPEEA